jgi:hypothetical protein
VDSEMLKIYKQLEQRDRRRWTVADRFVTSFQKLDFRTDVDLGSEVACIRALVNFQKQFITVFRSCM